MFRVFLVFVFMMALPLTACAAEPRKDICTEIQTHYENGTLDEITRSSYPENYDTSAFADLDNDGEDEEFRYFIGGNHVFLWDIINGEKHSPFMSGVKDAAHWHKASIIKFYDKFYLLFNIGNSYFVLQEITQYSPEEQRGKQKKSKPSPPYYHYKYVCNATKFKTEQGE